MAIELFVHTIGDCLVFVYGNTHVTLSYAQLSNSGRCPLCGSDKYEVLARGRTVSLLSGECEECGFVFRGGRVRAHVDDFSVLISCSAAVDITTVKQSSTPKGKDQFGKRV